MTLKSKLIATISAFCLVVGMLIAGVWASLHVQVEMGGDLTFTATDVNVRISGKIEGMETTEESGVMTLPTITFSANPDENSPSTVLDKWKNTALTFTQAGDDITITITIENLSDRVVNVKVKDSIGESAGVDKIIKNGTTLESVAEVKSGANVELNGKSFTYYTITLSLQNRNNSLATGVKYGYIIDLSDKSYSVEVVSSNDVSLGTAKIDDDPTLGYGQIRLVASTSTDESIFVGWKNNTTNEFIYYNNFSYHRMLTLSMIDENTNLTDVSASYSSTYFLDDSLYTITNKSESITILNGVYGMIDSVVSLYQFSDIQVREMKNTIYDIIKRCESENDEVQYSYLIDNYQDGDSYTAMFISKNNIINANDGYFEYQTYSGKDVNLATLTKINQNAPSNLTLPSSFDNKTVIDIHNLNDSSWIEKPSKIKNLTIPATIISIPANSFTNCNLTNLTFDENSKLTYIYDSAFRNSYLSYVKIPESVKSLGGSAFYNTKLLEFASDEVPAVSGESLTMNKLFVNETIYDEVVNAAKSGQSYARMDGHIYHSENLFEKDNVFYYENNNQLEFLSLKNNDSITTFEILPIVENKSVTSIGQSAFYNCSGLTSITIPDSVTSIGQSAFYNCSGLTSITIPDSVTSIGNFAFDGCNEMQEIIILSSTPPTLISGLGASVYNVVKFIYVPSQSVELYKQASIWSQYANKIVSVAIREEDENLIYHILDDDSLSVANYKNEIISVLEIPSSINGKQVTSIAENAFKECLQITSIIIPDSVTSIGDRAFYDCTALTNVSIGNFVQSIGVAAFMGCSELTSITIPNSVTSIGNFAFSGCSKLTEMTILATTPPTLSGTDAISSSTINIYVPDESFATYQEYCNTSNSGWSSSLLSKLKKISEKV